MIQERKNPGLSMPLPFHPSNRRDCAFHSWWHVMGCSDLHGFFQDIPSPHIEMLVKGESLAGCLSACRCSYKSRTHRSVHIFYKASRVPRLPSPKMPGSSHINNRLMEDEFCCVVFRYCVLATVAPLRLSNLPWVSFFDSLAKMNFTVNSINDIST